MEDNREYILNKDDALLLFSTGLIGVINDHVIFLKPEYGGTFDGLRIKANRGQLKANINGVYLVDKKNNT